ncbi:hypothetical protein [Bacillus sp. Marseille-P3800]|uniref:hypothetical protein n=1 Tax=Bacillus sp. Marseille-P3800 TaxID=2014782 RepID=UPI000C083071|nr:hypothetical protein [Bacillus sp. Marseille-P3800]
MTKHILPHIEIEGKHVPIDSGALNDGKNRITIENLVEIINDVGQNNQTHEKLAEVIRQSIPSGVLDYVPIPAGIGWSHTAKGGVQFPGVGNYAEQNAPNRIRIGEFSVNIHGTILSIIQENLRTSEVSSGHRFNYAALSEAPTSGYREDLVFLEAYWTTVDANEDPDIIDKRYGAETSRRKVMKFRIRTVAGVDFTEFDANGFAKSSSQHFNNWLNNNIAVRAQGGNSEPVSSDEASHRTRFSTAKQRINNSSENMSQLRIPDPGLFLAGVKDETVSKNLLNTLDGFVYAIPLFRVKRRNSGGYSDANPNGAIDYYRMETPIRWDFTMNEVITQEVSNEDYKRLKAGQYLSWSGQSTGSPSTAKLIHVRSKNGNNSVTFEALASGMGVGYFYILSERPDGKYANLIHPHDIVDLRHQVSLSGFNLEKLLEDSFADLIKGELRTFEPHSLQKEYANLEKAHYTDKQELVPTKVMTSQGEKYLTNHFGLQNKFHNGMGNTLPLVRSLSGTANGITNSQVIQIRDQAFQRLTLGSATGNKYAILREDFQRHLDVGEKIMIGITLETSNQNAQAGLWIKSLSLTDTYLNRTSRTLVGGGMQRIFLPLEVTADFVNFPRFLVEHFNDQTSGNMLTFGEIDLYKLTDKEYEEALEKYNGTEEQRKELAGKYPHVDSSWNIVDNIITDKDTLEHGTYLNEENSLGNDPVKALNWQERMITKKPVPVVPNSTYRFTSTEGLEMGYRFLDSNGKLSDTSGVWITSNTIVRTPSNAHKILFMFAGSGRRGTLNADLVSRNVSFSLAQTSIVVPSGRWEIPYEVQTGEIPVRWDMQHNNRWLTDGKITSFNHNDEVSPISNSHIPYIATEQATAGTWNNGDKVSFTDGKVRLHAAQTAGSNPRIDYVTSSGEVKELTTISWNTSGGKQTVTLTTLPSDLVKNAPLHFRGSFSTPGGEGQKHVPVDYRHVNVNDQLHSFTNSERAVVKADFKGKTSGNEEVIPHKAYFLSPKEFPTTITGALTHVTELKDTPQGAWDSYKNIMFKGESNFLNTASEGTCRHLFEFDAIRLLEDKFGSGFFNGRITLDQKVAFAKEIVASMGFRWTGRGFDGDSSFKRILRYQGTSWDTHGIQESTDSRFTTLTTASNTPGNHINHAGKMYFIAESRNTSGESRLQTSYVELELQVRIPTASFRPDNPFPVLSTDPSFYKPGDNILEPYSLSDVSLMTDSYAFEARKDSFPYYRVDVTPNTIYTVTLETNATAVGIFRDGGTSADLIKDYQRITGKGSITFNSGSNSKIRVFFSRSSAVPDNEESTVRFVKLELGIDPTPFTQGKKRSKKVNRLTFEGKKVGDMSVPHVAYASSHQNTLNPKDSLWGEIESTSPVSIANFRYSSLSKRDGILGTFGTQQAGRKARLMFEFDLSHLGLSYGELLSMVKSIKTDITMYGQGALNGARSHGVYLMTHHTLVGWTTWGREIRDDSSSSPKRWAGFRNSVDPHRNITSDMKMYFMLETNDPADDKLASTLFVDQFEVEVELKENVDYVKSNVFSLNAPTKRIGTEYPLTDYRTGRTDKIDWSYEYVPYQSVSQLRSYADSILKEGKGVGIMTYGTSGHLNMSFLPSLPHLPQPNSTPLYMYDALLNNYSGVNNRTNSMRMVGRNVYDYYQGSNDFVSHLTTVQIAEIYISGTGLKVGYFLVQKDGELMLAVNTGVISNPNDTGYNRMDGTPNMVVAHYRLKGRPLVY